VVDDDTRVLRMMRRILDLEGYQTLTASDGEAALNVFDEHSPDLILLDILMPGIDGYDVCRRVREFSQMPIIMVTAKESDQEKVKGLDAGADDYITKPFSSQELAARVRAVLRRANAWDSHPEPVSRFDELTIDFANHQVTLHDEEVNLTATWGEEYAGEHHILRVSIARLRQKLKDDPKEPRFISTRVGIGYLFMKPS